MKDTVLDAPVLAGQTQQRLGVGLSARHRGDAIGDFGGGHTAIGPLSNELEGLGQVGPVHIINQCVCAGKRPRFDSAVALVGGGGRLPIGGEAPSLVRGKHPHRRRHRRWRHEDRADSL